MDPVWMKWCLDAVRKVRSQKQRPNVPRITGAIRQHHGVDEQEVEEQLELAVAEGVLLKTFNQGMYTYRDPAAVHKLQNRNLSVNKNADLTKVCLRAIRELGEPEGSSLKSIQRYVQTAYKVKITDGSDLQTLLKNSLRECLETKQVAKEKDGYKIIGVEPVFKHMNRITNRVYVERECKVAFLVDVKDKNKVSNEVSCPFY